MMEKLYNFVITVIIMEEIAEFVLMSPLKLLIHQKKLIL